MRSASLLTALACAVGLDGDRSNREQVLKDFGVPAEVTVVSAHRTPDRMLDYARGAAGRGIQVCGSDTDMMGCSDTSCQTYYGG